jgi:hypothetical protein
VVRYDASSNEWRIGLLDERDPPTAYLVEVDARTGEVKGWVEHDWSFDVDGYP